MSICGRRSDGRRSRNQLGSSVRRHGALILYKSSVQEEVFHHTLIISKYKNIYGTNMIEFY